MATNTRSECNYEEIEYLNESMEEDEDTIQLRSTIQNEETENTHSSMSSKKRIREEDDGTTNEWTTVKLRRVGSRQNSDSEAYSLDLTITCKEKMPRQFAFAKILKQYNIMGISRVKYINFYKVILSFENEVLLQKFTSCPVSEKLGWKYQRTSEVETSYGVIKGIEEEISTEELLANVRSDVKIKSVMRLSKRRQPEHDSDNETGKRWIPSEIIRIGFEGPTLPTHVFIYDLRIKVEPYMFSVTQCSRCWKFGHARRYCSAKNVVCPKCTGNHDNCEVRIFKCVNCSENHLPMDKDCRIYQKEKKIRELMSKFNCTYKTAISRYVSTSPTRSEKLAPTIEEEIIPNVIIMRSDSTNNLTTVATSTRESFADVVKKNSSKLANKDHENSSPKTEGKKSKKQKSQKNNKKSEHEEKSFWDAESTCNSSTNISESEENVNASSEKEKKRKKKSNFWRVFTKIKDIIYNSDSMEEKIKQVVEIVVGWIFDSFVKEFIGTGKKGGMMSVFLMGCLDKRRNKWVTVTKVHTGHDDKTLERLQKELGPKMIKISGEYAKVPHWLDCNKGMVPDFIAADPKKQPVWEITGTELTKANLHTGDGISVRFPRVTRIRDDKDWETATNLDELRHLYKTSKEKTDVSLLNKLAETAAENDDSPPKKIKAGPSKANTLDKFIVKDEKSPKSNKSKDKDNSSDKKRKRKTISSDSEDEIDTKETKVIKKELDSSSCSKTIKESPSSKSKDCTSYKKRKRKESTDSDNTIIDDELETMIKKEVESPKKESPKVENKIKLETKIKTEMDEEESPKKEKDIKPKKVRTKAESKEIIPDVEDYSEPENPLPDAFKDKRLGFYPDFISIPEEEGTHFERYWIAYGGEVVKSIKRMDVDFVVHNEDSIEFKQMLKLRRKVPEKVRHVSKTWLNECINSVQLINPKYYSVVLLP